MHDVRNSINCIALLAELADVLCKDPALANGTMVSMDGTVMKDGKKLMIKDGDMMAPSGELMKK